MKKFGKWSVAFVLILAVTAPAGARVCFECFHFLDYAFCVTAYDSGFRFCRVVLQCFYLPYGAVCVEDCTLKGLECLLV